MVLSRLVFPGAFTLATSFFGPCSNPPPQIVVVQVPAASQDAGSVTEALPPATGAPGEGATMAVDITPPVGQPPPVQIRSAPPPMLVEPPPPPPNPEAVWVGGYWTWDGEWAWAHGKWSAPPQPGYTYRPPYYEHRGGEVVFVRSYWSPPDVEFVPPPPGMVIPPAQYRPGWRPGPRPDGPPGVFIPPPPGSRTGIIIPAPIGTHPAVVVSAPAVIHPGMMIRGPAGGFRPGFPGPVEVTVFAPPGVTRAGAAIETTVPAAARFALERPALVSAPPPMRIEPPHSVYLRTAMPPAVARPGFPPVAQPVEVRPGFQPMAQPVEVRPGFVPGPQPVEVRPGFVPGPQPGVVMRPGFPPQPQPVEARPVVQPVEVRPVVVQPVEVRPVVQPAPQPVATRPAPQPVPAQHPAAQPAPQPAPAQHPAAQPAPQPAPAQHPAAQPAPAARPNNNNNNQQQQHHH